MSPEFVAEGVTEEQYQQAGSKFVEMPTGANGQPVPNLFLNCEVVEFDWQKAGESYKFLLQITEEGRNLGKTEKIVGGAQPNSIWSSKKYWLSATGAEMPMNKNGNPAPNSDDILGKAVIGHWQVTKGVKQSGDSAGEETFYPKLIDVLPAGEKPQVADLGI